MATKFFNQLKFLNLITIFFFFFFKQFYYTDRFSGTNLFSRIIQWRSNMVLRFIKSNTTITKLDSNFAEYIHVTYIKAGRLDNWIGVYGRIKSDILLY